MLVEDNSFSLVSEDEGVAYFATKEEEVLNREQGALILEGLEGDEDGVVEGDEPSVLSIPGSVLLPIGLTIRAGVQRHEDGAGTNRLSMPTGWLLLPVLLLIAISSCALRSRTAWKDEALRLNTELVHQRKLAMLSTALLLERKGLNERLAQCNAERAERSFFENNGVNKAFMADGKDDDTFLKLKNCYFEASVSLGHCSRQWQKWWEDEKPESQDGGGENNFDDDDSFTFAMSKLMDKVSQGVKEGTNNLIDSSAQSLDHFRETFADLEHFWS